MKRTRATLVLVVGVPKGFATKMVSLLTWGFAACCGGCAAGMDGSGGIGRWIGIRSEDLLSLSVPLFEMEELELQLSSNI